MKSTSNQKDENKFNNNSNVVAIKKIVVVNACAIWNTKETVFGRLKNSVRCSHKNGEFGKRQLWIISIADVNPQLTFFISEVD
ncbi:MAG: hypothetical protein FWC41_09875 [Firmicutes bacterium]|nr:hypothetical protein [Bacillota bacterium]